MKTPEETADIYIAAFKFVNDWLWSSDERSSVEQPWTYEQKRDVSKMIISFIESSQSSIEEEIKTGSLSFVTWINNKQYYESRHMNQYSVWFRQDGESVANSTEELYEIYQNGPMKEENNQLNNKQ